MNEIVIPEFVLRLVGLIQIRLASSEERIKELEEQLAQALRDGGGEY